MENQEYHLKTLRAIYHINRQLNETNNYNILKSFRKEIAIYSH
jgi:hypothetical protein